MREGEPICDRFWLSYFENCTIVSLADGCGWGVPAKEAAVKASTVFVDYLKKFKQDILDSKLAARVMLRGLLAAHDSIVEGYSTENLFTAGTTTLIGGIVLPLSKEPSADPNVKRTAMEGQYVFIYVSLGDCKAFHYSAISKRIVDLTEGNRKNVNDAKDPGGRLGPYKEEGSPDLRNLTVYSSPCQEGDMILLVTDGVHDNLDPQQHGLTPADLNLESENNSWSTVKDTEKASQVKAKWMEDKINCIAFGEDGAASLPPREVMPAKIAQRLIDYAETLVKPGREFMEKNPNTRLPPNYKLYPGKMDHTTVVCFRVGSQQKLVRTNSSLSMSADRKRTSSF